MTATTAGGVAVRANAESAARTADGVIVDVAGAVRRPGVYQLARGARVHEAIAAAGGAASGADTSTLNRAADVVDGQQILVPSAADSVAPGGASQPVGAAPGRTVSINTADAAALDALPGIGPVTAQNIVADRAANGPFASVDDLDRVAGIGPTLLAQLESLVTV